MFTQGEHIMANQWSKYALLAGLTATALTTLHTHAEDGGGAMTTQQIRQMLEEQTRKLNEAKQKLAEQEAQQAQTRRELDATQRQLDQLKAQAGMAPTPAAPPRPAAAPPQQQVATAQPVGKAPEDANRQPEIAQIFEQPGVLTPHGKFVIEPSLQYSYSTANRVALVGYTIIPALLIGVIDVREVKRTTVVATMTGRYGITNRWEIEAKVPWVYRSDDTIGREILQGVPVDSAFNADGDGLGDVELTTRYQFNDGGADRPYYIGSLRVKSRTGTDPFDSEVNDTIIGLRQEGVQKDLPTGSGFWGVQPGLTVLFPSDPVVFFGGISYLYSIERDDVKQKTVDRGDVEIGKVEPGGILQFNFGMGLGLNERSSFSIGYDQSSVAKTKVNGETLPDSVTIQLATLLLGFSYRVSDQNTLNFTVGAGLTTDTPDITLTMRLPMSF